MQNLYNVKPVLLLKENKIALVGNSDTLLNKDFSNEIDSFEEVMRFNFADLMTKYTGTKTTIRWFNCPIDIPSANEHNPQIKNTLHLSNYISRLLETKPKIICWDSVRDKIQQFVPNLEYHTPNEFCGFGYINSYLGQIGVDIRFEIVEGCWPRTGFHAIITCLRSGCKPYLYGFDVQQKRVIKHYSKNRRYFVDGMRCHQVDKEIQVIRELQKKGLIIVR